MTPPLKYRPLTLLFFAGILLGSCTEEVATEMVLNGKPYPSSAQQPSGSEPSSYYEVALAADIIAVDQSLPAEAVTKRKWVLKGPDGTVLTEKSDVPNLDFTCDRAGWYSVHLQVNGQTEDAKTCWILAKKPNNAIADADKAEESDFEVLFPEVDGYTTDKSSIELAMRTSLMQASELDGISVRLNGRPFTQLVLDLEKELTTARLNLREGKNTIDIKAEIGGKTYEEQLVVEREAKPAPRKPREVLAGGNAGGRTASSGRGTPKETPDNTGEPPKLNFQGKKVENNLVDLDKAAACTQTCGSKQSIEIKAERPIQLNRLYFAPTSCGYYHYRLLDSDGKVLAERRYNAMTAFPTAITIYNEVLGEDEIPRMRQGETWTLELALEAGQASCPERPLIKALSSCGWAAPNAKNVKLLNGRQAIYKIDYTY